MATRRRLLLLQLGAAVAVASFLLAASSCCPVDAAPPPSRDASATTDGTDVPRTIDNGVAALAAVSRGSRRHGPPVRRLSDIPADAPASYDTILVDAQAPAGAPAAAGPLRTILCVAFGLLLFFFGGLVLFFLCVGLIMGAVGLVKGAALLASAIKDLYTAARAAHEKATRVHPSTRTTLATDGDGDN